MHQGRVLHDLRGNERARAQASVRLTSRRPLWFSVIVVKVTFVPVYSEPLARLAGIWTGVRR